MNLIFEMFPIALGIATPFIICALGGLYSERSGIVNIALEGIMLVGAFAGSVFTVLLSATFGDLTPWLALLAGALAGALYALIHAYASINLRANQTISGTALNMLSTGLTLYLCQLLFQAQRSPTFEKSFTKVTVPVLSEIPVIGELFFTNTYPTFYLAVVFVVVTYFVIFKTRFGLHLRSCGEFPQASASMGIHVAKMRYIGVLLSGVLGGIAGCITVLTSNIQFTVTTINGAGFIALACLIFGKWNPIGCLAAGIFFGFSKILATYSGSINFLSGLPTEFFQAIPYVLTIVALIIFSKKSVGPKAAGEIYDSGKR